MRLLFTITGFLFFTSACNKKSELTGEWTAKDEYGKISTYIFKEDNSVIIISGDKVFDWGFGTTSVKYKLNRKANPNQLDLVFTDPATKEELIRIRGVIEFLGPTTARIGFNQTENLEKLLSRPKSFEECEAEIITKK